jgi:serine protease Do
VAQASPAQLRERNIEHGLIVERAEGAAARAEVQAGDIVVAIVAGGLQTPVKSVDAFKRRAAELKDGQMVTLLIARGVGTTYVTLRAGE